MTWQAVQEMTARFLQDLVRIDTTNPPGHETPAAEYIARILRNEGLEPLILEAVPGRGNLIVRLKGDGRAAPLLLMSHLDVVPSEPDHWTHSPFGGDIDQGYMWGRGTLDSKELAAMELATLILLKRAGKQPSRDIILMASADEEAGGKVGADWLVRKHSDLIRAEYAISEGGGFALDILGVRFYACRVAEKGLARLAMTAYGRAGHGSQPHSDNAVVKLARAVERIGDAELPVHISQTTRDFVTALAARVDRHYASAVFGLLEPGTHAAAFRRLAANDGLCSMLSAMFRNTVTPTMLSAGSKINVIASTAVARCDARTLPGQTSWDLLQEVRPIVGKEIDIEFLDDCPSEERDYRSPLFDAICSVTKKYDTHAAVLPYLLVGATDARHVGKLGAQVYGFSPLIGAAEELDRVHGHDERISLSALGIGTRVLHDIVSEFCGSN